MTLISTVALLLSAAPSRRALVLCPHGCLNAEPLPGVRSSTRHRKRGKERENHYALYCCLFPRLLRQSASLHAQVLVFAPSVLISRMKEKRLDVEEPQCTQGTDPVRRLYWALHTGELVIREGSNPSTQFLMPHGAGYQVVQENIPGSGDCLVKSSMACRADPRGWPCWGLRRSGKGDKSSSSSAYADSTVGREQRPARSLLPA